MTSQEVLQFGLVFLYSHLPVTERMELEVSFEDPGLSLDPDKHEMGLARKQNCSGS